MPASRQWTRDELLLALRLYCRTPFGKLNKSNRDIVDVARLIGRTPSAVSMKACNFASFDPVHQARGVAGLAHAGVADRRVWDAFTADAESIAAEAEATYDRLLPPLPSRERAGVRVETPNEPGVLDSPRDLDLQLPTGPTEVDRLIRARRVQSFFRAAVLTSYNHRCAISGLAVPELLNASHIIPWSASVQRRADPRNGICLNALYDRAFDRGLITFDAGFRVVISSRLRTADPPPLHRSALLDMEGFQARLPSRFEPDREAMSYHRERVFVG